jgi:hypothetical protein
MGRVTDGETTSHALPDGASLQTRPIHPYRSDVSPSWNAQAPEVENHVSEPTWNQLNNRLPRIIACAEKHEVSGRPTRLSRLIRRTSSAAPEGGFRHIIIRHCSSRCRTNGVLLKGRHLQTREAPIAKGPGRRRFVRRSTSMFRTLSAPMGAPLEMADSDAPRAPGNAPSGRASRVRS